MAKLDATSVIEMECGIVKAIHTYPTFDEAANKFKAIVIEDTPDIESDEDDLKDMVDYGSYTSEHSGFEVYLVVSESIE